MVEIWELVGHRRMEEGLVEEGREGEGDFQTSRRRSLQSLCLMKRTMLISANLLIRIAIKEDNEGQDPVTTGSCRPRGAFVPQGYPFDAQFLDIHLSTGTQATLNRLY